MSNIPSLAHRKHKTLTIADIPDGTIDIGDAAFSLCPLLKQVSIPASVERIGCAAFCGSGVEEVMFQGIPKDIEPSAFKGCNKLKCVAVPAGTIDIFAKYFSRSLLKELSTRYTTPIQNSQYIPQTPTDLFGQPIVKRCRLTYNFHDFSWAKGDKVNLTELFSGPTALVGDPSYQFRRKCLFVFMKRKTALAISGGNQYTIPANSAHFTRKYKEKYGSNIARIFLFICDDGINASFFDEVRFIRVFENNILVRSIF